MIQEQKTPVIRVVKYRSQYPAEIIYTSDKGFTVRLKAMINRAMDDLEYDTRDEKFKSLMDFIGENAEPCLFASKKKMPNEPNPERSVAREADSSTNAGQTNRIKK